MYARLVVCSCHWHGLSFQPLPLCTMLVLCMCLNSTIAMCKDTTQLPCLGTCYATKTLLLPSVSYELVWSTVCCQEYTHHFVITRKPEFLTCCSNNGSTALFCLPFTEPLTWSPTCWGCSSLDHPTQHNIVTKAQTAPLNHETSTWQWKSKLRRAWRL